jgi:VWFA-related protein
MDREDDPQSVTALTFTGGMVSCRPFRFFVISLLLFAGTTVAAAQQTPPADRLFTDKVRVDVVDVDVFVTDRQGRPVYGLERDDFEILVDGREVEISNFRPPVPPAEGPAGGRPEAAPGVEPAPPRYLAVFVDQTNLRPDRRAAIMASLRGFLDERLALGDRVMVAAYDSRVQVLSGFGDDAATLERAIAAADFTAPSTFETQAEFNRVLRCLEVVCQNPELIWDEVRIYARYLRHRNRIMLAHLGVFVDSMAALPGRRSVLLVSDGIAVRPGESLFAAYQQRYPAVEHYGPIQYRFEANNFSLTEDIRELTDLANERRVTIYSLNGGGVVGNPLAMQSVAVSGSQMVDNEIDFIRDANYSGSLERVAAATGGTVIFKPTGETLDGLGRDLDGGYSLGFNPGHEPDDRTRSIKVNVAGDGYTVRHRDNYRLATDEGRESELTRLALIAAEAQNPLGISVEFAPEAERQGRKYVVSAAVRIPLAPLTLVPAGGDQVHGELEITFLLEDEEGHSTPIQNAALPLDLPAEAAAASGPAHVTYDVGFMVRSGDDQRLALTVTDTLGGQSSTLSWNLGIAKDGALTVAER